jgi:riboflavin-specific deaminase-like protein
MRNPAVTPALQRSAVDSAWTILLAARALADRLEGEGRVRRFGVDEDGDLLPIAADHPGAVLTWCPGGGWQSPLPPDDPRADLLNLYLPICSATSVRPMTVGHLGQSLDGFIATHSGDSQFVTGNDNIVHLHRMRALCDAVVVGAGTVAADDPQLTTRHVPGPSPLRAIFDPGRRLAPTSRVFTDRLAPTLYFCGRSLVAAGESQVGGAAIAGIDTALPGHGVGEMLRLLRARGCSRVFVEGGGVTVSACLDANLLDRLQIAIAPVLIGDGRPAIRLPAHARLRDCRRPGYRVFRMGGDVLFDCELDVTAGAVDGLPPGVVNRII